MKRRVAACLGALALAGGCSSGGGSTPSATPSTTLPSSSTTSTLAADREVSSTEAAFTDDERGRSLRTVIHHPTTGGPYPLVVFSHGISALPEIYGTLTAAIAARGYVVAAPEFPKTSATAENARANLLDVNNQPADVSFVIDEVLRLSAEPDGELSGLADPGRIGAAGHSLGAVTTLLTVYHSCCIDQRVDAAVALAGAATFGTGDGGFFEGVDTPLLMIHGEDDTTVAFGLGRLAFGRAETPKYFVTLLDAGHTPPYLGGAPWFEVVKESTLAFLDHHVAGDRRARERLSDAAEVEGVSTLEAVPG